MEFFDSFLTGSGLHRLISAAAKVNDDEASDIGLILKDKNLFHS